MWEPQPQQPTRWIIVGHWLTIQWRREAYAKAFASPEQEVREVQVPCGVAETASEFEFELL